MKDCSLCLDRRRSFFFFFFFFCSNFLFGFSPKEQHSNLGIKYVASSNGKSG